MVDEERGGIILPGVSEEEYETAGSKFVTFPPGAKVGDVIFRDLEVGMLDWDTPGQSLKVPVTVTEDGEDKGKEDKISFGALASGIWKGKEIYRAICGTEMPMKKGGDGKLHPAPDPMALVGKSAVGMWQWQEGYPGGDTTKPPVYYSKLVSILAAGSKPAAEGLL